MIKKEGSTYHLKTEDALYIRMNASTSDREYEIGEEVSAFIYPNRSGELFAAPVVSGSSASTQGEINGSFIQQAYKKMDADSEKLLDYITKNGGRMPLNDKSSPEDIKEAFNMSKGSFNSCSCCSV